MRENISKLYNVYKKSGFWGFWKKLYAYIIANYIDRISLSVTFHKGRYRSQIRRLLVSDYDRIVLWRSSFGFHVPLYQRPQHIACNLAAQRSLVLYEVTTMTDKIKTLRKMEHNLYLFNFTNRALNKLLLRELGRIDRPRYVQLYSTDWKLSVQDIRYYMENGFGFIYEYIDHITPLLSGTATLPRNIEDKYRYVMEHRDVYVIVTADRLKQDVLSKRGATRLAYSGNGVNYRFFRELDHPIAFDPLYQQVLQAGKPVICYYGALAKWFDYELCKKIAATGRYSVVLLGIKYDESFDESFNGTEPNITFLGPKDYAQLKYYANAADVLMVPFLLNELTRSTNPVKIFEYMALHKPIVTTDMDECRKYSSVLIGKDHDDFLQKLELALTLRHDPAHMKLLDGQARENDWHYKAQAIIDLISRDERRS